MGRAQRNGAYNPYGAMRKQAALLVLLALPMLALGQSPVAKPDSLNAPTLAVLLANRPAHIDEAKWLEMMEEPVHRSLYPLRITQATLDTLDGRLLDLRSQYIMVK